MANEPPLRPSSQLVVVDSTHQGPVAIAFCFLLCFLAFPSRSDRLSFVFFILQFPEFYSFPPFFTLQPVVETREKQLALWRELILRYHTEHKLKVLLVHDCPLWKNTAIQRQLSDEHVQVVMNDFVQHGHGEWMDSPANAQCRILWRKPDQLAADLYQWADSTGLLGSVCTLYELHSGEDVHGTSFQGADEELLRRALTILEEQGKCTVFKGETSSEDGIKWFK